MREGKIHKAAYCKRKCSIRGNTGLCLVRIKGSVGRALRTRICAAICCPLERRGPQFLQCLPRAWHCQLQILETKDGKSLHDYHPDASVLKTKLVFWRRQAFLFLHPDSSRCWSATSRRLLSGGLMCATRWTLLWRQVDDDPVQITLSLTEGERKKLLLQQSHPVNRWISVISNIRGYIEISFSVPFSLHQLHSLISDSVCVISLPLGAVFHTVQIISCPSLCDFIFPALLFHCFLCPPSLSRRLLEVILSLLQGSLVTEMDLSSLPTSLGPWRPVRRQSRCNFIPSSLNGGVKDWEGRRQGSASLTCCEWSVFI